MKLKLLFFLFLIILSGCGSQTVRFPNSGNGYSAELRFGSLGWKGITEPAIADACKEYGGVDQSSIKTQDIISDIIVTFKCNIANDSYIKNQDATKLIVSPKKAKSTISIEQAKADCTSLGFKEKTEKFGNCVLELTK